MLPGAIGFGWHGANVEPVTLNRQVSPFQYGEVEGSQGKQAGSSIEGSPKSFTWQSLASRGFP